MKTIFAIYAEPDRGDDAGRATAWVKADPVNQDLLVRAEPQRFFVPPYVGPKGWIGVYLDDADTDWDHLAGLLLDGWRMSAPKKLIARHAASLG